VPDHDAVLLGDQLGTSVAGAQVVHEGGDGLALGAEGLGHDLVDAASSWRR
jgi:hypothetical protein